MGWEHNMAGGKQYPPFAISRKTLRPRGDYVASVKKTSTAKTEEENTTTTEMPVITYDEITYKHKIYKDIELQNPTIGYVWISFPQFSSSIETPKDLTKRLTEVNDNTLKELDSHLLQYPPQNLISFSISRYLMGVGTFNISLYDSNYTELESKILKNKGIVAFKYGYAFNKENASPWHIAIITAYSINFALEGTYITFTGVSTGWAMNTVKKPVSLSYFKENNLDPSKGTSITLISDYIEKIAKDYGFEKEQCIIEPTLPVYENGVNLKDNKKGHIPLNAITTDTTFEHIASRLIEYSVNDKKQGGYVFYIEPTRKGSILHYHTLEFLKHNPRKLFTQFKNPNTVVRSFTPDWSMSLVQMRKAGKTAAIGYDVSNKKILKTVISNREAKSEVTGGTKITASPVIPDETEAQTKVIYTNVSSIKTQENIVAGDMSAQLAGAIQGTLVIQGTAEIKMLETIAIHVYIPKGPHSISNKTGNRLIHWISGDFKVIKITDKIEKGDFSTTLDLVSGGRELIVEGDDAVTIGVPSSSG